MVIAISPMQKKPMSLSRDGLKLVPGREFAGRIIRRLLKLSYGETGIFHVLNKQKMSSGNLLTIVDILGTHIPYIWGCPYGAWPVTCCF